MIEHLETTWPKEQGNFSTKKEVKWSKKIEHARRTGRGRCVGQRESNTRPLRKSNHQSSTHTPHRNWQILVNDLTYKQHAQPRTAEKRQPETLRRSKLKNLNSGGEGHGKDLGQGGGMRQAKRTSGVSK